MAFTTSQIAKAVHHLNYPNESWALTSITNVLNRISALSSDLEIEVQAIITELDAIDSARKAATVLQGTRVDITGSVYYERAALQNLSSFYNQWQSRLSDAMNFPVYKSPLYPKMIVG